MSPGAGGTGKGGEASVYFEFVQVGQQMRVAAIDAATGIEVIIIAPLTATPLHMQNLALAKLKKRLADAPIPEIGRRLF